MQAARVNFGEIEVQFAETKLNFSFSEIEPARLHTAPHPNALTARTTLQCASANRVHAARSTQVTLAGSSVQLAEVSVGKTEVQSSETKLNISFSETGSVHLHAPCHRFVLTHTL